MCEAETAAGPQPREACAILASARLLPPHGVSGAAMHLISQQEAEKREREEIAAGARASNMKWDKEP